jgi:glycosyltransferase involved in cell wall biosynthesis
MPKDKQTPKVSVMIITYNQSYLIEETILSVLSEPVYPNLEIVVADDCSTDGAQAVLQRLQSRYPNIIKLVLNEKNLGITGNCNAAFFCTTGEFIAVLGGDDLFKPHKIQKQVDQFIADPEVVLSYHPVEIFDSDSGKVIAITDQKDHLRKYDAYDVIAKAGIAGASSIMVRRSACPESGFDKRLPIVSDWKFMIDVALKGKVGIVNEVLGGYRKSGTGVSERTYELLEESLLTLKLVKSDNPHDQRLDKACDRGAARYISGEVVRSLRHNPKRAPTLANRMISHSKAPIYLGLWFAAHAAAKIPFLAQGLNYLVKKTASNFK